MEKLELRTILTDTVLAGRYRIEKLLGSGSMGEVYRATDLVTTRLVAVKRIHPYLITDEDAVQRFQREAKALSRLNHPGIVKFHDFYVADGFYFIVLNYLEGLTLEERLAEVRQKEKLLPLDEIKTILLQLCDALAYAHRQAIVHRDLKPANVMITPQGHAVIMDFGIAKLLDGEQLTGDGLSPGTPGYMSPEIIRGRVIDGRSDIYTLGIILYEMVTGQRPFRGNSRYDTMHSHLFEPIPNAHQLNPKTPPGLIHILNTALAKDPDDRFHSVGEMGQALRELDMAPHRGEQPRELFISSAQPVPPPPPPPHFVARPARQPEESTVLSRALPTSSRSWRSPRLFVPLLLIPLAFFLLMALIRENDSGDGSGATATLTLTLEDAVQVLPQLLPSATHQTAEQPSPSPDVPTPETTPTLAPTETATATRGSGSNTVRTNTPTAATATARAGATATSTLPQSPAATATRTPTRTPLPTATNTPQPTFTPAPLPSLTPTNTPRPEIDPNPTPTPKRDGK